jgi:hypothetical protein
MARSSDPQKVALWQRRFRRFLDSGLPVARFCAAEQVSECSFYYWQKKLGPLRYRGRAGGAEDDATRCESRRAVTEDRQVFRPVTVVPTPCGVVVWLPSGARIDVAASQLDTIRAVVAEIVQADHDRPPQPYRSSASRGDLETR